MTVFISSDVFWTARPGLQLDDRSKDRIDARLVRQFWANLYDSAPDFDGGNGSHGYEKWREFVTSNLKQSLVGGTVFEVGAGRGFYTDKMAEWGYEVTATDFAVGTFYDVTKEPWPGKFDNVVAIGVLHHILNRRDLMAAMGNMRAMAERRVVVAVASNLRKPNNHTRVWPEETYYALGNLVKTLYGSPSGIFMVFDVD